MDLRKPLQRFAAVSCAIPIVLATTMTAAHADASPVSQECLQSVTCLKAALDAGQLTIASRRRVSGELSANSSVSPVSIPTELLAALPLRLGSAEARDATAAAIGCQFKVAYTFVDTEINGVPEPIFEDLLITSTLYNCTGPLVSCGSLNVVNKGLPPGSIGVGFSGDVATECIASATPIAFGILPTNFSSYGIGAGSQFGNFAVFSRTGTIPAP